MGTAGKCGRRGSPSLGHRSDSGWNPFDGTLDDVAFYNKDLALDQVQAHCNATVNLSITNIGDDVVLAWSFGTLQEADQATGTFNDISTATSPYTNTPSETKFYRVKVQ